MESEQEDEEEVENPVFMEAWKPGGSSDLSNEGIPGQDFQSDENEEQRTAEANKIVRKHDQSSESQGARCKRQDKDLHSPLNSLPTSPLCSSKLFFAKIT